MRFAHCAHHHDLKRRAGLSKRRLDIGKAQRLARGVAIGTACCQADNTAIMVDRLIAIAIIINRLDLEIN